MDIELTVGQFNFARFNEDVRAAFAARVRGTTHDAARHVVIVHLDGDLTAAERAQLQTIVDTHDPDALTADQILAAATAAIEAAAPERVAAIPGWARWTEQQTVDYLTANVTDLASAKQVLIAMARMLIALRNAQWPHLEAGG
jgi:hypothetical protein